MEVIFGIVFCVGSLLAIDKFRSIDSDIELLNLITSKEIRTVKYEEYQSLSREVQKLKINERKNKLAICNILLRLKFSNNVYTDSEELVESDDLITSD